jgi:hypothetical protein
VQNREFAQANRLEDPDLLPQVTTS